MGVSLSAGKGFEKVREREMLLLRGVRVATDDVTRLLS
jgi:hypothetical protein